MAKYHIIRPGKSQEGPYDAQDIIEQYKNGTLPAETLVWCSGMKGWKPVKDTPLMEAVQSSSSEIFFPVSHPVWTCSLFIALPILCLYVCCSTEDRETLLCMGNIWGEIAVLLGFYLACWWLSGDNKICIKGLATHAILLSAVSFLACAPYSVIYAVNNLSSDDVTLANEMVASVIVISAYYFIPRKLYGFSVGRSWAVIGLMLLISLPLMCLLWGIFPGTL